MSVSPNYVPRDFKTINIMLIVNDGERALRFYNNAFGAEITEKLVGPDGIIHYAEIKIDDTVIMIREDRNAPAATSVSFYLYTGDAEGMFEATIMGGATEVSPVQVQFYGDRAGRVRDPFGYEWVIATHMEDVPPRELKHRFDQMFS